VSRFYIYDPSTERWLSSIYPIIEWTSIFDFALPFANFYKARDFSQTLPNKHGLRVTECQ
jgi:hypothetical protein